MALLDRSSPVPLYHQLAEELRSRIGRGEFHKGEAIPTEPELERSYGVSRVTVRRAVQELVREGFLETQQGRGTFARSQKATQDLNTLTSWAETMAAQGKNPDTRLTRIEQVPVPVEIAEFLGLEPGTPVTKVERVRYADAEPVCLMTNYLVSDLVPGLEEQGIEGESLYTTLENRYRIRLGWAQERVGARAATSIEARLLRVRTGAPLLSIVRVSYDFDDRPVEVVQAANRADRYEYSVSLHGRGRR